MGIIQREMIIRCTHYEIGDYIEYGWFRGEVVGINYPQLNQIIRVREVIRPASGREVGSTMRVPFNLGQLVEHPERRNITCSPSPSVANLKEVKLATPQPMEDLS